MTKIELVGTYQAVGRKFISTVKSFFLILDHRKVVTKTKPPTFIVAKTTGDVFPSGKKDQYVSSVYPVDGQTFSRIEYQGIQYKFELTETGAIIQPMHQMAMNNNSHLHL